MELEKGSVFDTDAEQGCIFIRWDGDAYKNKHTPTGVCRNFIAFDSDMIECDFNTMMVVGHPDHFVPRYYER